MKQHSHKIIALVLMLLIGKLTLSAQEHAVWPNGKNITPSFDLGKSTWIEYAKENVKKSILGSNYGELAILSFIVEKNGSLSDIKSLISVHGYKNKTNHDICATEAIRILKSAPKFQPGKDEKGQFTRMYTVVQLWFGDNELSVSQNLPEFSTNTKP
jgi:hypothetical protein